MSEENPIVEVNKGEAPLPLVDETKGLLSMTDNEGNLIVQIENNGEVTLGEKYEVKEAASRFWQMLKGVIFIDMTNVNSIGPDFLVDSGLLFRINQQILHPFGLAMSVNYHNDGWVTFGKIWDYRSDPEGMAFAKETFEEGMAKYNKFMEEFGNKKLEERKKALGYVVQE